MTTIQDLIEQWRGIAKAQEQEAECDAMGGFHDDASMARACGRIFTQCADELEKALAGIVSPTGGGVANE